MTNGADGVIFNIQRYSIHDGPGIRTTVFMKGCPLVCLWCQNPESRNFHSELFYSRAHCDGCGKCVLACPEKAIELNEGRSRTDRSLCKACGSCAAVCPHEARSLMGRTVSVDEVFDAVCRDAIFYQRSGGGVTLSGGEPLAQPEFAIGLLKRCKEAGIHTALDTCGHAPWETMEQVLRYVDLVLYDLKHMDPEEHRKATGISNDLILHNLKRMVRESHISLSVRIPVIPGFNDTLQNLRTTARFVLEELDPSLPVYLLPYHRLGESKREQLEAIQGPPGIVPPGDEYVESLKTILESQGLTVIIGG